MSEEIKTEEILIPAEMYDELKKHGNPDELAIEAVKKEINRCKAGEKETLVQMDAQGKIKLPKEFMEEHGWKDGDKIEFTDIDDGSIHLTKKTEWEPEAIIFWENLGDEITETWLELLPTADWYHVTVNQKKCLEIRPVTVKITGLSGD